MLSAKNDKFERSSLWTAAVTTVPSVSEDSWQRASVLTRWLISTCASVFPLTIFSVLFGTCIALPASGEQWLVFALVLVGLVLAHASNNLINDYVDHRTGIDTDNYFRTRYGVQVLESGLMSRSQFEQYLWPTGLLAICIGLVVCIWRSEILYPFAIAGAFFVLFYTYPLKRIALGEVAVLLTWGPLMVGGTYAAIHGEVNRFVLLAGLVYGLGPTVVIFAKHTDKASDDRRRGVTTLPSLLGRVAAPSIPLLGMLQIATAVAIGITYGSYGMLAWSACTVATKQSVFQRHAVNAASRLSRESMTIVVHDARVRVRAPHWFATVCWRVRPYPSLLARYFRVKAATNT